jgi:hypothetical protein
VFGDFPPTFCAYVRPLSLRWTVPKALFFFIRYYGLGMLLSDAVGQYCLRANKPFADSICSFAFNVV